MSKRSIFEEVGETSKAPAPTPGKAEADRTGARAAIRTWLWVLLALVAAMVIVGGLTRLTDSGLSITEWNLIIGSVPPLSEADWTAAFNAYKTTDEYKLQNYWMEMSDFKPIFWWEWGHRFLGRFLGVVWLLPLIYFAVRGMIPRGWTGRLILIGCLGGLQGAIGWWMVYSGLSVRVDVAPYRLATHLGVAFLIFSFIWWYIMKLRKEEWELLQARRRRISGMFAWSVALTTLLFVQILMGALVAGVDGGLGFTDWPMMDGEFFPSAAFEMTPLWSNLFENMALTQFMHRMTAYLLLVVAVIFAIKGRRSGHKAVAFWSTMLLVGVAAQAVLGIATLIHAAPLTLSSKHQFGALLLLMLALRAKFEMAYPSEQKISA
ncbi:MAG: COX15/CtaA family protein [Paracoccaceae bacterium]|jgi:heme a synthase|nr:COX15/CtaA family protein [Paracoccaceae bacterium]